MSSIKRRVGTTYEAFVDVVLNKLIKKHYLQGQVFWNHIPQVLKIEPDFYVGPDCETPLIIFMVSHSDSSKESNRKYLRSVAEMIEAKVRLATSPLCINVIFDATIKNDIKKLGTTSFDSQIIIGDMSYGEKLRSWVNSNEHLLPADKEDRAKKLVVLARGDQTLNTLLLQLEKDIRTTIASARESSKSLWDCLKQRPIPSVRKNSITSFRRGITKRFLMGNALSDEGVVIAENDAPWLSKLGLVKRKISGWEVSDNDVLWFLRSEWGHNYQAIASCCISNGFREQIEKVKNIALIASMSSYVVAHYSELTTTEGMITTLKKQHLDPSFNLSLPPSVKKPQNVWIYDFVASLAKASSGMSQSFGYSSFAVHPESRRFKIGHMFVGQWCDHFAGEFFNRRPNVKISQPILRFIARVLSDELKKYSTEQIVKLNNAIESKYIVKEYEDTLLSHPGFNPLLSLLIHAGVVSTSGRKVTKTLRTCFAEKAGLRGQSGTMVIANVKNVVLAFRSACKNPRDKRKELCAYAVGLRFTWDAETKVFKPRPGVDKLVLLLDGTWTQQDLDALIAAGWDEIYYPDEIDKLKASVLGETAQPVGHEEEEDDLAEAAENSKPYGRKKGLKP